MSNKAYIVRATYSSPVLVIKDYDPGRVGGKTIISIEGRGNTEIASVLAYMLDNPCPACGGLAGRHGEIFHGQSTSGGTVEGSYIPCPLEKKEGT